MSGYLDGGGGDWEAEQRRLAEEERRRAEAAAADQVNLQPTYEPPPAPVAATVGYDPGQYDNPMPAGDVSTYAAAAAQAGYAPAQPEIGLDPGYFDDPFSAAAAVAWGPQTPEIDPFLEYNTGYDPVAAGQLNPTGWQGGLADEYWSAANAPQFNTTDEAGNAIQWDPNARSTPTSLVDNNVSGQLTAEQSQERYGSPEYAGHRYTNPYMTGRAEELLDDYFYDVNPTNPSDYGYNPTKIDQMAQEARNAGWTQQVGGQVEDWFQGQRKQADWGYENYQVEQYAQGKQREAEQQQYRVNEAAISFDPFQEQAAREDRRQYDLANTGRENYRQSTDQEWATFSALLADYQASSRRGDSRGFQTRNGLSPADLAVFNAIAQGRTTPERAFAGWLDSRGLSASGAPPRQTRMGLGETAVNLGIAGLGGFAGALEQADRAINIASGSDPNAYGVLRGTMDLLGSPAAAIKYAMVSDGLLGTGATRAAMELLPGNVPPVEVDPAYRALGENPVERIKYIQRYLAANPEMEMQLDLLTAPVDPGAWLALVVKGLGVAGDAGRVAGALPSRVQSPPHVGVRPEVPYVSRPAASGLPGPGPVNRPGGGVGQPGVVQPEFVPAVRRPTVGGEAVDLAPVQPSRFLDSDFGSQGQTRAGAWQQPDQPPPAGGVPSRPSPISTGRELSEPTATAFPPARYNTATPSLDVPNISQQATPSKIFRDFRGGRQERDVPGHQLAGEPATAAIPPQRAAGPPPQRGGQLPAERYDIPAIAEDVRLFVDDLTGNPDYADLFVGEQGIARSRRVARSVREYVDGIVQESPERAAAAWGRIPGEVMRDVQDILDYHGVEIPDRGVGVPPRRDRVEVERRVDEAAAYRAGKTNAGPNMAYNPERTAARGARQGPALGYSPAAERQGIRTGSEARPAKYTDTQVRKAVRTIQAWEGWRDPVSGGKRQTSTPKRIEWARKVLADVPYMPREQAARIAISMNRDLPGMTLADARKVLSDVDYRGTSVRSEYDQAVDVPRALVAWEPGKGRAGVEVDDLARWSDNTPGRDRWEPGDLGDDLPEIGESGRKAQAGQQYLPGMYRGDDFVAHNNPRRQAGYSRLEDVERQLLAAREHYDEVVATHGATAFEATEGAEAVGVWRGGSYERGGEWASGRIKDLDREIAAAKAAKDWGTFRRLRDEKDTLTGDGGQRKQYKATAQEAVDRVAEAAREVNRLEAEYARLTDETNKFDLPEGDFVDDAPGIGGREKGVQGPGPDRTLRQMGMWEEPYIPKVSDKPNVQPRSVPMKHTVYETPRVASPGDGPVSRRIPLAEAPAGLNLPTVAKTWLKANGNNFAVAAPAAAALNEEDEDQRALYLLAAGGLGGVGVVWGRKRYQKLLKAGEASKLPGRMQTPIGKKFWRIDAQRNEIATIVGEDFRDKIASSQLAVGKAGVPAARQAETVKALRSYLNHGYFPGMLRPMTEASVLRDTQVRNALNLVHRDLYDRLPQMVREATGEGDFQRRVAAATDEALKAHLGVSRRGPLVSVPERIRNFSAALVLKPNPGWAARNIVDGYVQAGYAKGLGQLGMQRTGKSKQVTAAAMQLEQSGAFAPTWVDLEIVQDVLKEGDSLIDRYNPILAATTKREVGAKNTIYRTHYDNYFTTALAKELGLEDRFGAISKYFQRGNPTAEIKGGRLAYLPAAARQKLLGTKDLAEARAILRREIADNDEYERALAIFTSHQRDARDYGKREATVAMRNYADRSNLDVALSVVYPFHYWQTRGIVWNAHMAARYPLAAMAVAVASVYALEQGKDLPLADKLDTKIPVRDVVSAMLPKGLEDEVLGALDWYRDNHNAGEPLEFGLMDWAAPTAVSAVKGAGLANLRNLVDITDPVNMALAAERLFGWKGRSVAWGVTEGVARQRQDKLPEWLKNALHAGDPSYSENWQGESSDKDKYFPSAAGAVGRIGRAGLERVGGGGIAEGINETLYGKPQSTGEEKAIYAVSKQYGISLEAARRKYYDQGAQQAAVSLLGVPSHGGSGGGSAPGTVATPAGKPARRTEPLGEGAEVGIRRYGPGDDPTLAKRQAEAFAALGEPPAEGTVAAEAYWAKWNKLVNVERTAEGRAPKVDRLAGSTEMGPREFGPGDDPTLSKRQSAWFQERGDPPPYGSKGYEEYWAEYNRVVNNQEPSARAQKPASLQVNGTMGAGMFAGAASAGLTTDSEIASQVSAIWQQYYDLKATKGQAAASAWLNGPSGQPGVTRSEWANKYKRQEPTAAASSTPMAATAAVGATAAGPSSPSASARPSGANSSAAPKSGPSSSGGPKTEYGQQVASFFATHGQPPPQGTKEADAYWAKNGAAWRESFGGGTTRASGTNSSSSPRATQSRPTVAGSGSTAGATNGNSSSPFQKWLDNERPDLKSKIARSAGAPQAAPAERPLEKGITAKETATAWNAWEPLARAGKAMVAEAVPILEAHARAGGDPAPYVRRAKYGVYEAIRAWRGETRQGGDTQRGKWFAAVKALPATVEGLKQLAAIEGEVRRGSAVG